MQDRYANLYYSKYSYDKSNDIQIYTPPPVIYITNILLLTPIIAGGSPINENTIILRQSNNVPINTVTVIRGFNNSPLNNRGGILVDEGFITLPIAGNYAISINISFSTVASTSLNDLRALYIYHIESETGIVKLLAQDVRVPVSGQPTHINLFTIAKVLSGDRIFLAARQRNVMNDIINTIPFSGRIAIVRMN